MLPHSDDAIPARQYVEFLYQRYPGRIPLVAGGSLGFGKVFPFVFEDGDGRSIGCIALAWNKGEEADLVQVYHLNAFRPRLGHGRKMMEALCQYADLYRVRLTLIAQARWTEIDHPLEGNALREWYRQFGFEGKGYLTRAFSETQG